MATNVSLGTEDGQSLQTAVISVSATGATALITGVTGKIIRVYQMFFITTLANNISFSDGSTGLTGTMPFPANGTFFADLNGQSYFTTSAAAAFNINCSVATLVAGTIYYTTNEFRG